MAVYAAHLTRTLQGTPSVFQVSAQEALGATVKPALQKVVEYLAARYPNKCGWCMHWYDELYLLFDCCLQYYYLKHYAASFSESFYGLIRVPLNISNEFNSGQHLPLHLEKLSLGLLVLLPYVRNKVEKAVERWREDLEDGRLGKTTTDNLRRSAIKIYSIIHTVTSLARLVQLARYISGGTTHALELAMLGLTLRDAPPRETPENTWTDVFRSIVTGQIGSAIITFPMVGNAALRAVEYGAFGVQFLRWWDARQAPTAALPTPVPPETTCAPFAPAQTCWKHVARRTSVAMEKQMSAVFAVLEDTHSVTSFRLHILLRVYIAARASETRMSCHQMSNC